MLTKVDISGPARTASWTSYLSHNYPGVPVVPVEAYAQKPSLTGPTRYEPHLPGTFRERLVHTLRDVHEQMLQPPQWVTAPRAGESEQKRLQRIDRWRPRVKRVVDWDGVLQAKGKLVGKAVGGSAGGHDITRESEGTEGNKGGDTSVSDIEEEQLGDAYEWKEPEFLSVGLVGTVYPLSCRQLPDTPCRPAKRRQVISSECNLWNDTSTCLANSWKGMATL